MILCTILKSGCCPSLMSPATGSVQCHCTSAGRRPAGARCSYRPSRCCPRPQTARPQRAEALHRPAEPSLSSSPAAEHEAEARKQDISIRHCRSRMRQRTNVPILNVLCTVPSVTSRCLCSDEIPGADVSAIAFALFAVFSRHTLYLQVRLPPVRADATAATRYTCHSPSRARRCHTATTLFIGPPEFTFRHLPAASVAVGRRGHAALRRRGMILVGSCGSHRAGQQQSHGSSCFASGRAPAALRKNAAGFILLYFEVLSVVFLHIVVF